MGVQERRPETMARSVCGQGLYRPRLAGRLWRGGSDPRTDQGSETGNEAHPCAFAARQLRHLDARPGVAEIRDRGPEGSLSDPDRARRDSLVPGLFGTGRRSEEHTSELQSLMRISYAVFCLKKKNETTP